MGIEYIEIRNSELKLVGIIDTAISVIWHTVYYGVGDFEIYAQATDEHIELLKQNAYVTRVDKDDTGIIERVNITRSDQDGDVIVASGRFAKCLLDRRVIYKYENYRLKPTVLKGNVEVAVRGMVSDNAINCTFDDRRNLDVLRLGQLNEIPSVIVDENNEETEIQVPTENLLSYTDEMLRGYELGAKADLNRDTYAIEYEIYKGIDRSADIVFSQEFDNLVSSDYLQDNSTEKNAVLISGEGEGADKFYSAIGATEGLKRRELFVNASSQSKTINADELQNIYPTGTFVALNFIVDGVVTANLVVEDDREYTLTTLREKFPSGIVNGAKYIVSGVTYALQIYGQEERFKLTPLGYKAMLEADDEIGKYTIVNSRYAALINSNGRNELSKHKAEESFSGTINVTFGNWILDKDYFLGDLVSLQDNKLGKYVSVRITEITEVQDENGYTVDAKYE